MIFGGGSVSTMGLTCSVFAAWMWTTSVFGSAETYALFGIWGPITYVIGACIAFGGLIGMIAFLHRHYPKLVTWLEFIQMRYGRWTKIWFYLFAVIVPAYVLIEQGVGIAFVLETFYGSSFRIISFLSVILTMGFVLLGGMKLVIAEEKLATLIIIAGFVLGAVCVIAGTDIAPVKLQAISVSELG
jgi:Na+/proline symporter